MKTTIELAKEAHISIRGHYDEIGSTPSELERFAALIRADEREHLSRKLIAFYGDSMDLEAVICVRKENT